jgi:hypothetical protein
LLSGLPRNIRDGSRIGSRFPDHAGQRVDLDVAPVVVPIRRAAICASVQPFMRATLSKGQSYGVFSKNAWRLADMDARHALLRAGFGFGQHAAIHGRRRDRQRQTARYAH